MIGCYTAEENGNENLYRKSKCFLTYLGIVDKYIFDLDFRSKKMNLNKQTIRLLAGRL